MTQRILVTWASKHGATIEIAETIGHVLEQSGLKVDVLRADTVYDLTGYHAVVLGSAVYIGQWRKEAVKFLEQFELKLAALPVWLFSSGPTGTGDPVALMKGWRFPEAQQPIASRIQPRDIAVFHGSLDMSKLGFGEKLIVRGIGVPTGDFRNWDAITAWAETIARTLTVEAVPHPPTLPR